MTPKVFHQPKCLQYDLNKAPGETSSERYINEISCRGRLLFVLVTCVVFSRV